jgi:hypothetical protein
MTEDMVIRIVWHWQIGWLRRPEMDDDNGYCYEEPDGDLVYTRDKRHRKNVQLVIWRQPNGETYTTFSKAPGPAPVHKFVR